MANGVQITIVTSGITSAIQQLNRCPSYLAAAGKRAMSKVGALVQKTAKQYAPISPSVTILRKLSKAGGNIGASYEIAATKKRAAQRVVLTKFYAERLDTMLSANPRATGRPKPGGLQNSITFTSNETQAQIFVPANSEAGKYAYRIHEEKGITWFRRGPGTQVKGAKADSKFIERAIKDNTEQIQVMIQDELVKALDKLQNGAPP